MADDATWRKNIPEDFQGKHAEHWDGEINVGMVYKSGVAILLAFIIALGVCWLLIIALLDFQEDPYVSPIPEASLRRLPPSPLLQAKPEAEMEEMRADLQQHMTSYGWLDELEGRVHIPIERAMTLVLADGMPTREAVEPAVEEPVDLTGVDALVEPGAPAAPAAEVSPPDTGVTEGSAAGAEAAAPATSGGDAGR